MEKEKKKVLIVIDVQNDFVTGSLGTPEAQAIIPNVKEKFDEYKNNVSCRLNSGNHVLMQQLVICIENLQTTTIK